MTKKSLQGIHPDELLRFTGNSEQAVLDKGWSINGTPDFSNGECDFTSGDSDYINCNNVNGLIKTVICRVKLDTTTEDIIDFDGSIKLIASTGTLSIDNLGDEVMYVNGSAGSTITTDWAIVAFTTSTGIDASALKIGNGLDGKIDYFIPFNSEFSANDILAWYEGRMFSELPKSVNGSAGVVLDIRGERAWLNDVFNQSIDFQDGNWSSSQGGSATGTLTLETDGDGQGGLQYTNFLTEGKRYKLCGNISSFTGGVLQVWSVSFNTQYGSNISSTGEFEIEFNAVKLGSNVGLIIRITNGTTQQSISFSELTIKEVDVIDASGNGNNASLVNMDSSNLTTDAYERAGKALSFDEPGYITTGNNTIGSSSSALSVFAIIKPAATTGQSTGFRTILSKGTDITSDSPFGIAWQSNAGEINVLLNDSDFRIDVSGQNYDTAIGNWQFVGFTYDGTTVRVYRNGVEIDNQAYSTAIDTSNEPLLIGYDGGGGGDRYWIGDISQTFVLNYTLGPAQIKAMWRQLQNGGFGR